MIDIVIVNWNAGQQLRECVDSIKCYGDGLVASVVVVDNGSIDGSEATVEHLAGVTLLRAGENLGFGKACNLGARAGAGKFVLFLNPDAALYEGTLARTVAFLQEAKQAGVGICGVQLIDEAGQVARSCSRFPTAPRFMLQALGLDRLSPRLKTFMEDWDHSDTRRVDQVMGAFFLVRRDLFAALDGFDERFFVYYEEVDFAYRARHAGWDTAYFSGARAFHKGGGTSHQVKARRLFYFTRSRILFGFKHFSKVSAALVLLVTATVEPVSRVALAIARRSWSSVTEVAAGFGMLYRWLPAWLGKGVTR